MKAWRRRGAWTPAVLLVASCTRAASAPVAPVPAPAATPAAVVDSLVRSVRAALDSAAARLGSAVLAKPDSARDPVTPADIAKEVSRVFGDSAQPPVTDSAAAPGAPVWDIDVQSYETHDRVEHFVGLFTGGVRAPFEKSLQRQTRYGALIRLKLREGGLPEDLIYLALIESWYDPHAYSRAAAVGMWQFMTGTARGVGLRVDWWVDERRDPVRSTEGAVRLLRALREQFGSLFLAAAAYNGGGGRVSRGLARYADDLEGVEGDDRFFTLADTRYLRPETRDYVPKLIAAALVGKEPARYGVAVDSLPPLVFDSVRAPAATPLGAVARAAQTTLAELQELNPHLIRGMTPPREAWWVRVSAGAATGFEERFGWLDSAERAAVKRVISKKGESMASIARRHGLTAKQLNWYNPGVVRLKSGNLSAAQAILVPSRTTVEAALDVPNPSIERYGRAARSASSRTHVVRQGETLSGIAKRYGTTTATLMRLNGLRKALIVPGQALVVRASRASAPRPAATAAPQKKKPMS